MGSIRHDPSRLLADMMPAHGFFIGLDSDGCVFDSMDRKQKECFCPNFIDGFSLQAISGYAREAWEFVNLYSGSRGCNRFRAVLLTLELLGAHPGVRALGVTVPKMDGLRDWLRHEAKPSMATLEAGLRDTGNADLELVRRWSLAVDASAERIAGSMTPFPFVRDALEAVRGKADVVVISQTPLAALKREWQAHGLDDLVRFIAGQELGDKSGQLALAAGGKYPADRILVLGDAPGDLEAARNSGALFYPIVPGREEASWLRFGNEALGRFFSGTYDGDYQTGLVDEFNERLPGKHGSPPGGTQ